MRIGLVEFLLILAIASLTVGPQAALFVDRWVRRATRSSLPRMARDVSKKALSSARIRMMMFFRR